MMNDAYNNELHACMLKATENRFSWLADAFSRVQ